MNAKKAREIKANLVGKRIGITTLGEAQEWAAAEGYLAALEEGPEVASLIDTLESIKGSIFIQGGHKPAWQRAEEALLAFRRAAKGE